MLGTDYPVADLFLTMLWFFLFIIWIWLLIMVFSDIFRSHDIGGGDDTATQLQKLADLKTQGVITDAEFDAQKAKLLA